MFLNYIKRFDGRFLLLINVQLAMILMPSSETTT